MEYEVIITDKLDKVKNKRARKGIKIKSKERGTDKAPLPDKTADGRSCYALKARQFVNSFSTFSFVKESSLTETE